MQCSNNYDSSRFVSGPVLDEQEIGDSANIAPPFPDSRPPSDAALDEQETRDDSDASSHVPDGSAPDKSTLLGRLSPFWQDRFIEGGLVLSIALYYVTGNEHLGTGSFFHMNPLVSIPFLLIFAMLCWYRLSFTVALLPLALPYYMLPKSIIGSYSFSVTEIVLWVCLIVASLQLLRQRRGWQYWLSWQELRDRLGPFAIPILIFIAASVISIVIAYAQHDALRAFRREVFDPLLYFLLVLFCLRSRQDLKRLLGAFLGTGLVVAFLGIIQYLFFMHGLTVESSDMLRVNAVYGSANNIGLLFDYVLPIGLTMAMTKTQETVRARKSWQFRAFAIAFCVPLLVVLYLSQSRGAWVALGIAVLFIAAHSIRSRKLLLINTLIFVVVLGVVIFAFHTRIVDYIIEGHMNVRGVSTVTKRLYLWQSALHMILDSPWFGYGLDNWLCHYSANSLCHSHLFHYIIMRDPVTGVSTGLGDEPQLSHPHNIFLHVWVSVGLFGLLAFVTLLGLFFWLFARIRCCLRSAEGTDNLTLQWMTVGVGAAMLAALIHGQVDNAFLEQDLSFCFWTLIAMLLVLRVLVGTVWKTQR